MFALKSCPAPVRRVLVAAVLGSVLASTPALLAQDRPYWDNADPYGDQRSASPSNRAPTPKRDDAYRPYGSDGPPGGFGQQADVYGRSPGSPPQGGPYPTDRPYERRAYDSPDDGASRSGDAYRGNAPSPRWAQPYSAPDDRRQGGWGDGYRSQTPVPRAGYGEPYAPPPDGGNVPPGGAYPQPDGRPRFSDPRYGDSGPWDERRGADTYSQSEVIAAGHRFFGSISQGLAGGIEYAFQSQGRPNGYILGEDAGGAFVAGLRYGEGTLYTKDVGNHRVYWQGPSLGYDFGGEGSKTMVLVYNLRDPSEIYARFGGVQGAAYLVGGVSVQFQVHEHVTLAVIRSGVGLRLGANVGYLKYTRTPTWNPF